MKGGAVFSILFGALLVAGCGGSSSSNGGGEPEIAAGYYRGTFTVDSDGWIEGSGPMFVDLVDENNFDGEAMSDTFYVDLHDSPEGGVINGTALVQGDFTATKTAAGFDFTFTNGSSVTASGELTLTPLPTLGSTATVPSAGDFDGEFVVVAEGRARTFGISDATVDAEGDITIQLTRGKGYISDAIFTGHLEANGTISDAVLVDSGSIITQTGAQYSYEGGQMVIRFGQLVLTPASCFVTLHQAVP